MMTNGGRDVAWRDETPRIVKIGDALSQLLNVIWPFWDHRKTTANESTSGRCYRENRRFRHVIDACFPWQRNPPHCERAYLADVERAIAFKAQHIERAIAANKPECDI